MANVKDIIATTGTYEKDGQTKYITRNVGRLIETSKGLRIKLDASFNPAGCKAEADGSIWLACFDQKQDVQKQTTQPQAGSAEPPFDDEIPF